MPSHFTATDAAEIALAPFIAIEERREESRRRYYEADARASSGVSYGATVSSPFLVRSDAEIRAAAQKAYDHAKAFAETPRGRFLGALRELEAGYAGEAEDARNAFARGFASADRPADPREVGRALKALADINTPDARVAIGALAEILGESRVREAA